MKKNIYVFNDGEFKRKDNTVYFETDEGKKYLPIEDINDIMVFGEVTINKRFLEFMTDKKICLHFFNTMFGYYKGTYYPREHLNSGYMILKQAETYINENRRLELAKSFVEGSYRNIEQVLSYYDKREKSVSDIMKNIENISSGINLSEDVSELMGIEGNIRDEYYKAFDKIIENDDFIFEGRSRRPPKNHLNAMISFGNSLMYVQVLSEIYKTNLDPRIGYLHSTNFRRFSLNLDVAEIFKPIMIDRIIFGLLSKKVITKKDFEKDTGGILLKEKGRKAFVQEFDNKLKTTITHRGLGKKVSYQRLIRMELYKLQKHFMEEETYKSYVSRW